MKETSERIFRKTLGTINIPAALEKRLARSGPRICVDKAIFDLSNYTEIVVISFGKASRAMAEGLTAALAPEYSVQGILVTPPVEPPRGLPGFTSFTGGHPIPTAGSFEAGRAILDRLHACGDRTIVFFLISGGGSSLVEWPLDPGLTPEKFQKLHHALVTCGAPIEEINAVRSHISATKGGRLAAAAPFSAKVTFAISDVPAGKESAVASGPTVPDPTTIADAESVISLYKLAGSIPFPLRETPKFGDAIFANSHFEILLGEHELLHAAHRTSEGMGFVSVCENETDNWPIGRAADHLLRELCLLKERNLGRSVAIISSGEVSSPVTGDGIGGRNAAFVLACVAKIAGTGITVLSGGTDGVDGNSDAAGAIADGNTFFRARDRGLDGDDFARRSDAFTYFNALDDALVTGPTGNNLRDLRILLMD